MQNGGCFHTAFAGSIPQRVCNSHPIVYIGEYCREFKLAGESNPWGQVANLNPLKLYLTFSASMFISTNFSVNLSFNCPHCIVQIPAVDACFHLITTMLTNKVCFLYIRPSASTGTVIVYEMSITHWAITP